MTPRELPMNSALPRSLESSLRQALRGRSTLAAALLLGALMGVGCVDYSVELASPHEKLPRPVFKVERVWSSDEPLHYDEITIYTGDDSNVEIYWDVEFFSDTSPPRITYGESPGTHEKQKFRPLDKGRHYTIAIGGPGHMGGTLDFVVDEEGNLHED